MICHRKKFIFIDICKTAGTSINKTFSKKYKCIGKHHSITNIVGDFSFCTNLTKEQIDKYFKFTFVRNPYDRIVSLWLWGVKSTYKEYNFKQFVLGIKNKKFDDHNFVRYIPMVDWLCDKSGKIRVDYIGRYENLEDDFAKVCKKVKVNKLPLEKINTAEYRNRKPRKKYWEYYDDETRDVVTEIYKKDIDKFDYKFNFN